VHIEDVEAAASVHQHLGEPGVPDDRVDHQWVLARVGDAVRVIFAAEGDGILRPVEEGGRSLLCSEDLVPLPLALAVGHVHGRPSEDEEDVFQRGEAAGIAVTPILLGLAILRGGAAVVSFEQVALLEGVLDRRLVVRTGLLQHVVEYAGASRGRSRAPSSWVNSEGLVPVVVAPLHVRLAARLLAFLASLVLLLGLFGLAALRERVVHALALLPVEDGPHRLLAEGEAGGDVEQLVGVNRRAAPELAHEVPAGRALEEGMYDLGLGHTRELRAALREAPYEVPERHAGFWVHARRSQEFPGRTYIPWKFPAKVRTRSSQLWIWLAGRCSSHVRAESARCSGRLWMITSSVVALPSRHARR
jgi:hypothetical protein